MKSEIYKKPLPYFALIIAHLIWGINFVAAKIVLPEIPIMSLAFLRFFFAAILLLPFLFSLAPKDRKIKSEDFFKIFLAGLLMVTIHISLFYEGLIRTTAINASVLTLIAPVLSVIVGWWFLKEKIYWINLSGIALGLLGTLVIIGLPLIFLGNLNSINFVGNILLVLAAISLVAGSVVSKKLLITYPTLIVTLATFVIGALTFAVPAFLDYQNNPSWITEVSILGFLGFLYITILSTVCAFFLLMYGLKKLGVEKAHLFQYMEPAVAATLAVPLLGERISFSFIIGTCLIVLAVYWGTLGKSEHHNLRHKVNRG